VSVTTHFPKASYVPGAAHAFCDVAGGPPLEWGNFPDASRIIPHRTHAATSCVRRPIALPDAADHPAQHVDDRHDDEHDWDRQSDEREHDERNEYAGLEPIRSGFQRGSGELALLTSMTSDRAGQGSAFALAFMIDLAFTSAAILDDQDLDDLRRRGIVDLQYAL
jgi:hypothetical protein